MGKEKIKNRLNHKIDGVLTLPSEIGAIISGFSDRQMVLIPIEEMQAVYEQIIAENMGWTDLCK